MNNELKLHFVYRVQNSNCRELRFIRIQKLFLINKFKGFHCNNKVVQFVVLLFHFVGCNSKKQQYMFYGVV